MCDEKTIKALPKWFVDWLKSKGYHKDFIDNLKKFPLLHPDTSIDKIEDCCLIASLFSWSESSQGEIYWDGVHLKFTKEPCTDLHWRKGPYYIPSGGAMFLIRTKKDTPDNGYLYFVEYRMDIAEYEEFIPISELENLKAE